RQPHRYLHGDRRVQADALERDAVPELHDEAVGAAVAVDVAEPVGDDQHAGASGRPPAAQTVTTAGSDAESPGLRILAGRSGQPERAMPGRVRLALHRECAVAYPCPASEH